MPDKQIYQIVIIDAGRKKITKAKSIGVPGIVPKCRTLMQVEEASLMKVLFNREELKEVRKQSKLISKGGGIPRL